jgi:GMP synthase (glutamine-hydrolysing)
MHRDVVTALPEGAVNLGFSDVCEYQGIYIPGRVFTLQGHPEFNETIMSILLDTRAEQGVFEDAVYKSGTMRSGRKHDGLKVSESVWRLLLGSTYE